MPKWCLRCDLKTFPKLDKRTIATRVAAALDGETWYACDDDSHLLDDGGASPAVVLPIEDEMGAGAYPSFEKIRRACQEAIATRVGVVPLVLIDARTVLGLLDEVILARAEKNASPRG